MTLFVVGFKSQDGSTPRSTVMLEVAKESLPCLWGLHVNLCKELKCGKKWSTEWHRDIVIHDLMLGKMEQEDFVSKCFGGRSSVKIDPEFMAKTAMPRPHKLSTILNADISPRYHTFESKRISKLTRFFGFHECHPICDLCV